MSKNLIIYYTRRGQNYFGGDIRDIAKGNTELLDAFNAELQKLIDDGTVEQIILKWNE